jgi:hypothetical protein
MDAVNKETRLLQHIQYFILLLPPRYVALLPTSLYSAHAHGERQIFTDYISNYAQK